MLKSRQVTSIVMCATIKVSATTPIAAAIRDTRLTAARKRPAERDCLMTGLLHRGGPAGPDRLGELLHSQLHRIEFRVDFLLIQIAELLIVGGHAGRELLPLREQGDEPL